MNVAQLCPRAECVQKQEWWLREKDLWCLQLAKGHNLAPDFYKYVIISPYLISMFHEIEKLYEVQQESADFVWTGPAVSISGFGELITTPPF